MATIGIFDSGSGGLSVLKEIRRLLPGEKYVYYSDNANCPYGDKSAEFVSGRASAITEHLLSEGADIIVIACNTATAAAIDALRARYNVPFIGLEPAVKPAAVATRNGTIGVLATAGTLAAGKYLETRDRNTPDVVVVEHVGAGFVELVENGELDGRHTEEVVRESLQPLLDAGADTIVLGCTHYPFLRGVMERIAGPSVDIIDPAPAVARQVVKMMEENKIPLAEDCKGEIILESSGPSDTLRALAELI